MNDDQNKKKLLVVDDDPQQLAIMQRLLSSGEHDVLTAGSGAEAMGIILGEEPRIVITDWFMPGMDGIQLCKTLRQHEGVRFVYIIVMTAQGGEECMVQALDAGADDFVRKPLKQAELLARLRAADRIVCAESDLAKRTRELHRTNAEMALTHQKLNKANEQLRRMATTDELTGLLNRREAMSRIEQFWASMERYDQIFSCIMLDIDFFKKFNDTHGHAAGDKVLKTTAQVLRSTCRKTDLVSRVGGEEFLILCPGVGADGAKICAEHLRAAVEKTAIEYEGTPMLITASLGVAGGSKLYENSDALIKAADEALYASKAAGRNRVTVAADLNAPRTEPGAKPAAAPKPIVVRTGP
ncbi:MAG TPA: diguanylate cyclase [Phycisphaerae bacterium]|nr:diguanylate cyclase [Phycisphaerae bacterium]